MVTYSFFGVFMQCVHFYKKKLVNAIFSQIILNLNELNCFNELIYYYTNFFALQAIYRYSIVMKSVRIGYMRLAFIFSLGNLIG